MIQCGEQFRSDLAGASAHRRCHLGTADPHHILRSSFPPASVHCGRGKLHLQGPQATPSRSAGWRERRRSALGALERYSNLARLGDFSGRYFTPIDEPSRKGAPGRDQDRTALYSLREAPAGSAWLVPVFDSPPGVSIIVK